MNWDEAAVRLARHFVPSVGLCKPPWWKFRARRIYRQAAREFAEYGRRIA